jgi:hypothetical protein
MDRVISKDKNKRREEKKNPVEKKRNAPIFGFHRLSQNLQDGLFGRQLLFTTIDLQVFSEHLKLTSRHFH